jgi:hypothetical protein
MDQTPRRDWRPLALLLGVALGLRAWQLTHTEVAARDSIGYIRIAWRLEHQPWRQAVREASQHPLYPLTVGLVSHPVRRFGPADLAVAMQLSAQLAAALAGVLLVVPSFYLGKMLFDRRVGFWGALLLQALPVSGQLMADGLSEPLFLLLATSSLCFAVRALRGGPAWCFALAGLCGGLAYLTRLEGLLIVLATGAILLAGQAVRAWRRPWGACLGGGAALVGGTLLVAGPYMAAIGHVTVKASALKVFDNPVTQAPRPTATRTALALWHPGVDRTGPETRRWWGAYALGFVLVQGTFYVGWLPALVAAWHFRGRFRSDPGWALLLLVAALVGAAVYRVAVVVGYASERHTMLILLGLGYLAAAGFPLVGAWLARRLGGRWPALAGPAWGDGRRFGLAGLTLLAVAGGVKCGQTLHGDRGGFREAGRWLADHALPGDLIEDPYAWAHYYAGGVFRETEPAPPRPADARPPVRFVVVEASKNDHSHLWQVVDAKNLTAKHGRLVRSWRVPRGEVQVYEVPPGAWVKSACPWAAAGNELPQGL